MDEVKLLSGLKAFKNMGIGFSSGYTKNAKDGPAWFFCIEGIATGYSQNSLEDAFIQGVIEVIKSREYLSRETDRLDSIIIDLTKNVKQNEK